MNIEMLVLVSQGAAAAVTVALFAIKPFRMWFLGIKERKNKISNQEAAEHESVKCLLRSEIVRIYYANREKRELHSFEFDNVSMLYEAYKKMGGNSFVDTIWERMQGWKIIP
jgi:hypothetical protein